MLLSNSKNPPQVMLAMTPFPYSIGMDESVGMARDMMVQHDIRHLPVKDQGVLVGVISDRDILLAMGTGTHFPSAQALQVRAVCLPQAYIVDVSERLDSVLLYMAQHHIGVALVVKEGRLAGIFTTADACRLFGGMLRDRFPVSPDNDPDVA
ncbi:MAG: CBS domain-containing protein [Acidiferrobacterales bacterium]